MGNFGKKYKLSFLNLLTKHSVIFNNKVKKGIGVLELIYNIHYIIIIKNIIYIFTNIEKRYIIILKTKTKIFLQ